MIGGKIWMTGQPPQMGVIKDTVGLGNQPKKVSVFTRRKWRTPGKSPSQVSELWVDGSGPAPRKVPKIHPLLKRLRSTHWGPWLKVTQLAVTRTVPSERHWVEIETCSAPGKRGAASARRGAKLWKVMRRPR